MEAVRHGVTLIPAAVSNLGRIACVAFGQERLGVGTGVKGIVPRKRESLC